MTSAFTDEALQTLINVAQEAQSDLGKVQVITIPHRNEIAIINGFNQTVTREPIDTPKREHQLLSLEDVLAWARDHIGAFPVIWLSGTQIIVTLDAPITRTKGDRATYQLKFTPEFTLISEMATGTPDKCTFDQAALIKLIRTKLWESFADVHQRDQLIRSLRNVVASQASNLQQGRGTYEAGYTSTDATHVSWDDRLRFCVKLFQDPLIDDYQQIEAAFEVDAKNQRFSIWPSESGIADALNRTLTSANNLIQSRIADLLTGELSDQEQPGTISVYRGKP